MLGNPARMATEEGNSLFGGTIGKPPVERDMDMAEDTEASSAEVQRSGKIMRVSFAAATKQWEPNNNGK